MKSERNKETIVSQRGGNGGTGNQFIARRSMAGDFCGEVGKSDSRRLMSHFVLVFLPRVWFDRPDRE